MLVVLSLSLGRRFIPTALQVSYWITCTGLLHTHYHCKLFFSETWGCFCPTRIWETKKDSAIHPICFSLANTFVSLGLFFRWHIMESSRKLRCAAPLSIQNKARCTRHTHYQGWKLSCCGPLDHGFQKRHSISQCFVLLLNIQLNVRIMKASASRSTLQLRHCFAWRVR